MQSIQTPDKAFSNVHEYLWNPEISLRRLGGDSLLLVSMIEFFLEDAPVLLSELEQLIDAGDADESARQAHSLKGLCSNFEATAATQLASDVECACLAVEPDHARVLLERLREEIRKLTPELLAWRTLHAR